MSFGLCNAPATFSRLMELLLRGINWDRCLIYLDDIVIHGTSVTNHLTNFVLVLERLRKSNLVLKPKKCKLFQINAKFLGHVVSEHGVQTDQEKISAVK